MSAKAWCLILLLLIAPAFGRAADSEASPASIRELFTIMGITTVLDGMGPRMDRIVQSLTADQLADTGELTQQDRKELQQLNSDMVAVAKHSLAQFEPRLIEIFSESVTQSEVDALMGFYRTEVGQGLIHKLLVQKQSRAQIEQSLTSTEIDALQAIGQDQNAQTLMLKLPTLKADATRAMQEILEEMRAQLQSLTEKSAAQR